MRNSIPSIKNALNLNKGDPMKILLLSLSIASLTLFGTENNQNKPMDRHHHIHKSNHHHKDGKHEGMHYRKSGGKYQRIVEEELDPQRKLMNQQMHDINSIMKKNIQIIAAERRQIKNLNSLDAKKKSKDAINAACESIKEEINKFQTQIFSTIDSIDLF